MSNPRAVFFYQACLVLLLCGCTSYQLGTGDSGKLSFRTLYLEPVENSTHLSQSRALVSTKLRESFAKNPRVTLVNSPDAADVTLSVAITAYRRDVLTVRDGDTGLARKFNLTLGTICTLKDRRGNRILFEKRPIEAQREAFTDSGQLQSEAQTLPILAEAVVAKVVRAALDVW